MKFEIKFKVKSIYTRFSSHDCLVFLLPHLTPRNFIIQV